MKSDLLPLLQSPAVAERTSAATRQALEDRAHPAPYTRYLEEAAYRTLQTVLQAILPQQQVGTEVDLAETIDRRLAAGTNAGWRYADLPPDGEAYTRGLRVLAEMLEHTPMKTFDNMPPPAREGYLRCVANGDVDGPARFPLSKFLQMLKTDAVRAWMAHPSTMQRLELYGFADGSTGRSDGPTATEGWSAITPNKAMPFEQGAEVPESER